MKILLVPDKPGWAFDHRARDLKRLQSTKLKFDLKYLYKVENADAFKYDIIYPMTFSGAVILNNKGVLSSKLAAGITSIRSLEKNMYDKTEFDISFIDFLKQLRGINTFSDEIMAMLSPHCKVYKTRVGIFEKKFCPAYSPVKNNKFTVGWVGRIDKEQYRRIKGYDTVLTALQGLDVQLKIRTYKENYVPRDQMAAFYQGLDCFICSSISEGLPNPLLEAASCGVPIITTRVGIAPELIENHHNGIIVPGTANAKGIRDALVYLIKHPNIRKRFSNNIRSTVLESWTWEKCKKDWEYFFENIM